MPEGLFFALFLALMAFSAMDQLAFLAFWPPAFRWGVTILTRDGLRLARPVASLDTVVLTDHGKFKVHAVDHVLVRDRTRFFGGSPAQSVVGSITWQDGSALFQARLQISYVLFMVIGFILWTIAGAFTVSIDGVTVESLRPIALGWLVISLVTGVNVVMGRMRMTLLLREYEAWANGAVSAPEPTSEPTPEGDSADEWWATEG